MLDDHDKSIINNMDSALNCLYHNLEVINTMVMVAMHDRDRAADIEDKIRKIMNTINDVQMYIADDLV